MCHILERRVCAPFFEIKKKERTHARDTSDSDSETSATMSVLAWVCDWMGNSFIFLFTFRSLRFCTLVLRLFFFVHNSVCMQAHTPKAYRRYMTCNAHGFIVIILKTKNTNEKNKLENFHSFVYFLFRGAPPISFGASCSQCNTQSIGIETKQKQQIDYMYLPINSLKAQRSYVRMRFFVVVAAFFAAVVLLFNSPVRVFCFVFTFSVFNFENFKNNSFICLLQWNCLYAMKHRIFWMHFFLDKIRMNRFSQFLLIIQQFSREFTSKIYVIDDAVFEEALQKQICNNQEWNKCIGFEFFDDSPREWIFEWIDFGFGSDPPEIYTEWRTK